MNGVALGVRNSGLESFAGRRHLADASSSQPGADGYRVTLHQGKLAQIDDLYIAPGAHARPRYDPSPQLMLSYLGLCSFSFAEEKWVFDANRAWVLSEGWGAFRVGANCASGYAAVVLGPTDELLKQMPAAANMCKGSVRARRAGPSSMRLRVLTQQLLHIGEAIDPLKRDECIVHAVCEAVRETDDRPRCSKAIERAKELLHARAGERLKLEEIAAEVGLCSVYLTQEFTRCEGVPLYRYQMQLRLTRALLELPHCGDITALALDLGFSSHSHFSSAFRKAFGTTPSDFRMTNPASHPRIGEILLNNAARQHAACRRW